MMATAATMHAAGAGEPDGTSAGTADPNMIRGTVKTWNVGTKKREGVKSTFSF